MNQPTADIRFGDCITGMATMPAGSADLTEAEKHAVIIEFGVACYGNAHYGTDETRTREINAQQRLHDLLGVSQPADPIAARNAGPSS